MDPNINPNPLDSAFFEVTNVIINLQTFFMNTARGISYVVLLIAVLTAAVNHAIMGGGIKENIIKISKALVFFSIVMYSYPNIVSWMTDYTFTLARDSVYLPLASRIKNTEENIMLNAKEGTAANIMTKNYADFFKGIITDHEFTNADGIKYSYSVLAPSAALVSVMQIALECMKFPDKFSIFDIGIVLPQVIKGFFCGFFVIFTGCFAVLEYLIAYIEFMFISSVGIILFPFSLFEGTKFIAESYLKAMLGFFVKLLFCTICIFFMFLVYLSLAREFAEIGFVGQAEQMVKLVFCGLLTFFISKSAPAMAQSLISGSPSLSAGGAISTVASGVAAAASVAGLGANVLGAGMRGGLALGGAVAQAGGAAKAAVAGAGPHLGNDEQVAMGARAFVGSLGSQALEGIGNTASDLSRSLIARPLLGRGGHGGSGNDFAGQHGVRQQLLAPNHDGTRTSYGQFFRNRADQGKSYGQKMADKDYTQWENQALEPANSVNLDDAEGQIEFHNQMNEKPHDNPAWLTKNNPPEEPKKPRSLSEQYPVESRMIFPKKPPASGA